MLLQRVSLSKEKKASRGSARAVRRLFPVEGERGSAAAILLLPRAVPGRKGKRMLGWYCHSLLWIGWIAYKRRPAYLDCSPKYSL